MERKDKYFSQKARCHDESVSNKSEVRSWISIKEIKNVIDQPSSNNSKKSGADYKAPIMSQNSGAEDDMTAARITFGSVDSSHYQRISALDIAPSDPERVSYSLTSREKIDKSGQLES